MFRESDEYVCNERILTGNAGNNGWAYTVDVSTKIESGKTHIQMVKWKARLDKTQSNKKYWKKYWEYGYGYNVGSIAQWRAASRAVDECFGSFDVSSEDFREIDEADVLSESDSLQALESELAGAKAAKAHYKRQSIEATSRVAEIKRNARHYRKVLQDFSEIVNNTESTETDVHEFIEKEKPMWMFGLDYATMESKVRFPPNSKTHLFFDLMLRRHDSFLDLAELKGPNESLFDRRTRERSKPNVALATALGQVLTYLDACDRKASLRLFKPKAWIVIGNRRTDNPRHKRLLSGHLARIEVVTYDEMISRGKALLKYVESYKPV